MCYHVVTATRDREPVFSDVACARIVVDALQFVRRERAYLLAYALMPDHMHAVLVPRDGHSISQVMQTIKGYTARAINEQHGRQGRLWQRSFHDRTIRDERQLFDTIEYIHMNPVVGDLTERPRAYEFSSAERPESVDLEAFYGLGRG
jgi:REP element-mobilizing transposase RayT